MEQVIEIAQMVLTIGWALVVILLVVLLIYVIRLVLMAKWIVWWVKKTVETAQQSILSPMSMVGSFFASGTSDVDEEIE